MTTDPAAPAPLAERLRALAPEEAVEQLCFDAFEISHPDIIKRGRALQALLPTLLAALDGREASAKRIAELEKALADLLPDAEAAAKVMGYTSTPIIQARFALARPQPAGEAES